MIRFACPGCNATYSVDDAKGGKAGKCPKCAAQFVIPAAEAAAVPPPPPAPTGTSTGDAGAVEIKPCPKCGSRLSVAPADLGVDVECPYCQAVYPARRAGDAPAPPSRRLREDPRPSRRPRDDEEEDDRPRRSRRDDDEEDDRPVRRSRRDDDDEPEEDDRPRRRRGSRRGREDAAAATAGPGVALIVVGGFGLMVAILEVVLFATGNGGNPFAPPAGPNQQAAAGFQAGFEVGQYIGLVFRFIWAGLVIAGGVALRGLGSGGLAKAGAIFAMLPCNPCCLIGLPVGIWALTTLGRPDVGRYMD